MATITDVIKSSVLSLGDPKEPVKLILKDLWNSVLPPQKTEILFIDALYESLIKEAGSNDIAWDKDDLKKVLRYKVDLESLQLSDMSSRNWETEFTRKLIKAFEEVALIPDRTKTKWDFENIARNIIVRAKARFLDKISEDENAHLFRNLLLMHSANQGIDVERLIILVTSNLPELKGEMLEIQRSSERVLEGIQQLNWEIIKIQDYLTYILEENQMKLKSVEIFNEISQAKANSLELQLENYQENLDIIQEQISSFVSPTDIPAQYLKNVAVIHRRIDDIKEKLGIN